MGVLAAFLVAMIFDPIRALIAFTIGVYSQRWWAVVVGGVFTAVIIEVLLQFLQAHRGFFPVELALGFVASAIWVAVGLWAGRWFRRKKGE